MTTDYTAAIRAIVPDLEYSAEFIPQSRSRNAGDKRPSLNWRITLRTPRGELVTDYMQGIGILPEWAKWRLRELGYGFHGTHTVDSAAYEKQLAETARDRGWRIPAPPLEDVVSSLILDATVLDYSSFESWAQDCGYDEDSRSAERTYRACLEIALRLRAMIGDEAISQLREALQDL